MVCASPGKGRALRANTGAREGAQCGGRTGLATRPTIPPPGRRHEESLAIWRQLGDRRGIARTLHVESLTLRRQVGDKLGVVISLERLAALAASLVSPLRAARICGAAERIRAEIGSALEPKERSQLEQRVAAAGEALGDDAASDRAWQDGRSLRLEQAIDIALKQTVEQP